MGRKGWKNDHYWNGYGYQSHSARNLNNRAVLPDERVSNLHTHRTCPQDGTHRKYHTKHLTRTYYHVNGRGRPLTRTRTKNNPATPPAESPALGSEEHTMLKIKQTSAIIMRQILNPEDNIIAKTIKDNSVESEKKPESSVDKTVRKTSKICKNKSKETSYNVEDIHNKIMYHLTNLNNGKKRNLINSNSTGYDEPIQQIMKQKRLEISRALRNMCSDSDDTQSTDFINSIIPDMGIKIEDLPHEFLEELRCSFDFSTEKSFPMMNYCYDDTFNHLPNTEMYPQTAYDTSFSSPTTSDVFFYSGNNSVEGLDIVSSTNLTTVGDFPQTWNSSTQASTVVHKLSNDNSISFRNDDTILNEHVPSDISHSAKTTCKDGFPDSEELKNNMNTEIGVIKPSLNILTMDTDFSPSVTCTQFDGDKTFSSESLVKQSENEITNPLSNYESDQCISSQFTCGITDIDCNEIKPNESEIANALISSMDNFEMVGKETKDLRSDRDDLNFDQPSSSSKTQFSEKEAGSDELNENVVEIRKEDIYNEEIDFRNESEETSEHNKDSNSLNLGTDEYIIKDENQCKSREYAEVSTQTVINQKKGMHFFLSQVFPKPPNNKKVAIGRMSLIDDYISDLIQYRRNVLYQYLSVDRLSKNSKKSVGKNRKTQKYRGKVKAKDISNKKATKKRKNNLMEQELNLSEQNVVEADALDMVVKRRKNSSTGNDMSSSAVKIVETVQEPTSSEVSRVNISPDPVSIADVSVSRVTVPPAPVQNMLIFEEMKESFLDLKVNEDKLMAATESGKIYFFSLEDGRVVDTLKVSERPISSFLCLRVSDEKQIICVGSFDGFLKLYNFYSKCLLSTVKLEENVQCMEYNWGYFFLGGSKGSILRYSVKKRAIEYEDKFSNDCIFVLKATQEGARRVLLIGSRNSPVVIRDAMNGLHLRTMENLVCPTVYSLVIENNRVYCGTTNLDILVFNFHNGLLENTLKATNAKGIGCLKSFGRLLFASCHNGNVYVYNLERNIFIGTMAGPGGVILSMEVVVNQVVVGTMLYKFVSLPIPEYMLRQK